MNELSKNELCPLCGQRPKEVRHHVYLYDDGIQFNSYKKIYPKWTIPVCRNCNASLSFMNKFILEHILHFKPPRHDTIKRTIIIPDKLDEQFRAQVVRRLGYEKGNISKAIVEAIKLWLNKDE